MTRQTTDSLADFLKIKSINERFLTEVVFGKKKSLTYNFFFDDYDSKEILLQSPIERVMLGILYDLDCLDVDNIIPQFRIGKFKVDFMVITQLGNKLVIECDGHDFHEKTKTQAQYDKERDRFLMSKGYTVFHFTGSELYNNFIDIENEIFDYLCTEWESSK